ncbi:MAG: hypothetical protein ABIP06_13505 [Pyrinomonadaceae bacterium]
MSAHDEMVKISFVEWYAVPEQKRVPRLMSEFAVLQGVPERTLSSWKKATWFREKLAELFDQVNVSPDRLQAVMDAMHAAAIGGNTKAAELYMRAAEVIAPKQMLVKVQSVDEMSDRELQEALKGAAAELDKRDAQV